jgi:hypothetical protein
MGAGQKRPLRLASNPRVEMQFTSANVTSDAGLFAFAELDRVVNLTLMAHVSLKETRRGKNIRHHLLRLFRQAVCSRVAGYEDVNDAERLACDPALRIISGIEDVERTRASPGTRGRFETEILATKENLKELETLNTPWMISNSRKAKTDRIVIDVDSTEIEVYKEQEQSAYNGHIESRCYHPIFAFNQFGDCEAAKLRPGNVHSADGWEDFIPPIVGRYTGERIPVYFRADAAFAKPELYEYLEDARVTHTIRIPANDTLEGYIMHLLRRPMGRPPRKPIVRYASFRYQAKGWDRDRRVVSKVEWHAGELFPRIGFIVTNSEAPPHRVGQFYNGRGKAEQYIKEGKYATSWTRLSCHRFEANAVRLQLGVLAYNLLNFMKRFALPPEVKHWSLQSIQLKRVKIGARVIRHARKISFQMAEVAVSQGLMKKILDRIATLPPVPSG